MFILVPLGKHHLLSGQSITLGLGACPSDYDVGLARVVILIYLTNQMVDSSIYHGLGI